MKHPMKFILSLLISFHSKWWFFPHRRRRFCSRH